MNRPDSTPVLAPAEIPYDADLVTELVSAAAKSGNAARGAALFSNARQACLSCHRVTDLGGTVGPELTEIGRQRTPQQLVESLFWPKREVKPEFVIWQVVTAQGTVSAGYRVRSDDREVVLKDPASGALMTFPRATVEEEVAGSTPMPDGQMAALSRPQQLDLIRFLTESGTDSAMPLTELRALIQRQQSHAPESFPFEKAPLQPADWPNREHPRNRQRLYDFYPKQAEYFRRQHPAPMLLTEYPGLDGGQAGHWGYQTEQDWADDRWNRTVLGSVQAGVFTGNDRVVPRGVCIRLGDNGELAACFNPDTLTYEVIWKGGFVSYSATRHGFMDGVRMQGTAVSGPVSLMDPTTATGAAPFYRGYFRHGQRIVFSVRIGETEYLDSPWVKEGQFVHEFAPAAQHSLRQLTQGGPATSPQVLETKIKPGSQRPYAVDTIELPFENPWNALMFCGGHGFLADGSAMVCTIQGDVWHVTGLDSPPDRPGTARWRRFAAGLNHALGLVVADDRIFVMGRDQLTELHDLNGDGEADFYECINNAFETSPAGHDFICGLERDASGNFYTASGNQGLLKLSPDGKAATVIATGFRNSDGLGLLPDGTVTVPCSEGEWTPTSMICAVKPEVTPGELCGAEDRIPFFGYRGPNVKVPTDRVPEFPLAYIPRGLDNSSGGQIYVDSDRWGPMSGQLIHLSFGMGTHFLVLRDEVKGQPQGAVIPLKGDFRSGVHRGRFSPTDGQLYVTGMDGWVSFTPDDGCFQRVRYTGDPVQLPTGFHVHQNGIRVTFSEPVDRRIAEDTASHFAQCWNYRYSAAYGSAELSTSHPGVRGHDVLNVSAVHVAADHRTVFLEIPDLQPVSQLYVRLHVNAENNAANPSGHDLFVTVNQLDEPFTEYPGYSPQEKIIAAHPLLTDMKTNAVTVPNPWQKPLEGAREVVLETGRNLTYQTRELRVKRGEALRLTLSNPDVVPHNWALVQPGALRTVGELANRLISDPEAVGRHYIPKTDQVLSYTDVVPPGEKFSIWFHAPATAGSYPFLCTFPGHWMVMNGVMIVEE